LRITLGTAPKLKCDIALLELLETDPFTAHRGCELRQELRANCTARFNASMAETVSSPLLLFAQQGAASDFELSEVEQSARALRAFESEARRLGGSEIYDRTLTANAGAAKQNKALSLVERARLVEILCGPEAGFALLSAG